ncbi:MAG TPA: TonB-dependent receptor [Steroidobacteraceae bacterium]|jgi:outer membrane receptor protein involved in Fe transport|nr:TonB-dependent receptor [Steroidobacteraceae bacterium]
MSFPFVRIILLGLCTIAPASFIYAASGNGAGSADLTASTATGGAAAAASDAAGGDSAANGTAPSSSLPTVVVSAQRLNAERSAIETQTGASMTTLSAAAITALPGGSNVQLSQVLLQAPDVVQDSFGQLHVRGDHSDLQYRLNGIILPEGISVFGQTLDPRLISSMNLITGALPAEYGLRTAGIIDMTTRSGLTQPGGTVSLYGGSHSTFEPSGSYGGSAGNFSYFVSADLLRNDLGIESPDASSEPLHDHSTQLHGFSYLEDILDPDDRVSLILGASSEQFQIPEQHGLEPGLGLTVDGISDYLSNNLNENQHELTQYAIASWQHSQGTLNWQSSLSARYTSLDFEPDWIGDLLYNGIAQNAFKADTALAEQTDAAYELSDAHTLRAGFYLQHDNSSSQANSWVLPVCTPPTVSPGCPGGVAPGDQTSDVPLGVADDGSQDQVIESLYLQDEWKALSALTINYGLRFDAYHAYSSGSQLSPRLNAVWQAASDTTVHAGYSRYFTPPPFELIAGETFTKLAGTTALPPGSNTQDSEPIAERANYYDVGAQQKLLDRDLTLGIDSYYEQAQHLIDEGQFGAPIILTPFNYRFGKIAGLELTSEYAVRNLSAYGNLAFQSATGKDVESSQFNFDATDLAYIADDYIHLDHEERISASAGVSYDWRGTRASLDMIFGTGLRQDTPYLVSLPEIPGGLNIPNGDHTPSYTQWNLGLTHAFPDGLGGPLTARFDVVNLFDKIYEIRSGSGIGVFAPQYGARRGLFFGLSQDF